MSLILIFPTAVKITFTELEELDVLAQKELPSGFVLFFLSFFFFSLKRLISNKYFLLIASSHLRTSSKQRS